MTENFESDLGGELNIAAIDVGDERYIRVVEAITGCSPCAKRGQKGATFFFRYANQFKSMSSRGEVELLFIDRQAVLASRIRHETAEHYCWTGEPLAEAAFDALPIINLRTILLLNLVVGSHDAAILTSGEDVFKAGIALFGHLRGLGVPVEKITAIVEALLPLGYDGEAID